MSAQNNAARPVGGEAAENSKFSSNNTEEKPKQQGKSATILSILKSGQSLNRFEAERHGDHALNSTIAELRSKGYQIQSEWELTPTRFGKPVRVKRYFFVGAVGNGEV